MNQISMNVIVCVVLSLYPSFLIGSDTPLTSENAVKVLIDCNQTKIEFGSQLFVRAILRNTQKKEYQFDPDDQDLYLEVQFGDGCRVFRQLYVDWLDARGVFVSDANGRANLVPAIPSGSSASIELAIPLPIHGHRYYYEQLNEQGSANNVGPLGVEGLMNSEIYFARYIESAKNRELISIRLGLVREDRVETQSIHERHFTTFKSNWIDFQFNGFREDLFRVLTFQDLLGDSWTNFIPLLYDVSPKLLENPQVGINGRFVTLNAIRYLGLNCTEIKERAAFENIRKATRRIDFLNESLAFGINVSDLVRGLRISHPVDSQIRKIDKSISSQPDIKRQVYAFALLKTLEEYQAQDALIAHYPKAYRKLIEYLSVPPPRF